MFITVFYECKNIKHIMSNNKHLCIIIFFFSPNQPNDSLPSEFYFDAFTHGLTYDATFKTYPSEVISLRYKIHRKVLHQIDV